MLHGGGRKGQHRLGMANVRGGGRRRGWWRANDPREEHIAVAWRGGRSVTPRGSGGRCTVARAADLKTARGWEPSDGGESGNAGMGVRGGLAAWWGGWRRRGRAVGKRGSARGGGRSSAARRSHGAARGGGAVPGQPTPAAPNGIPAVLHKVARGEATKAAVQREGREGLFRVRLRRRCGHGENGSQEQAAPSPGSHEGGGWRSGARRRASVNLGALNA